MKYNITLNDEDYILFNIFYANNSKAGKRSMNMIRLIVPVLSLFVVMRYTIAKAEYGLIITEAVVLTALSVIWWIFAPKILERNIRRSINKMKADSKLPYCKNSEIEFREDVIEEKSGDREIRVKYTDIENIYTEKDYIYIFYNVSQAFIIPCHCLDGDRENVIEYITKKKDGR